MESDPRHLGVRITRLRDYVRAKAIYDDSNLSLRDKLKQMGQRMFDLVKDIDFEVADIEDPE